MVRLAPFLLRNAEFRRNHPFCDRYEDLPAIHPRAKVPQLGSRPVVRRGQKVLFQAGTTGVQRCISTYFYQILSPFMCFFTCFSMISCFLFSALFCSCSASISIISHPGGTLTPGFIAGGQIIPKLARDSRALVVKLCNAKKS